MTSPDGSVSLNDMPLNATEPAALFAMVMVRIDEPPAVTDVGANALVMPAGGATSRFADAGVVFDAP